MLFHWFAHRLQNSKRRSFLLYHKLFNAATIQQRHPHAHIYEIICVREHRDFAKLMDHLSLTMHNYNK